MSDPHGDWRPQWPPAQADPSGWYPDERTTTPPAPAGPPTGPAAPSSRRAARAERDARGERGDRAGRGARSDAGPPPDGTHRPRLGGLLRAEVGRFRSRRFIGWLLGLATLAYLVAVPAIVWTQFARTTDEVRAEARARIEQIVRDQNTYRDQCLTTPLPSDVPEGTTPELFCGPPPDPSQYPVEEFLPKRPFTLADNAPIGAVAVGMAVAALAFVVGATWLGAEWSARTMMALLFWETRRLRVLAVKTVVLVLAVGLFAAAAQGVWAGSAVVAARTRGSTAGLGRTFWADLAALGGRAVLLAVLVSVIGAALAHLIRGTGAALGLAFVYVVAIETAVRVVRPGWEEWLLTTNAAALVLKGGTTIYVPGRTVDEQSGQVVDQVARTVSNLHGGLVLGGVAVVLLLLGGWLFRRRDLT